jgi:GT2 family glycosyltransferase
MEPESQPPAPAVVAVVVTCDPGPWFGRVLRSLASQDYPNLSVLVIDSGSLGDPSAAVAEVLPEAFIRRLDKRTGFGSAANHVLELVEGASHFLICHDDVALAPDAVRLLVEEAFRSNAGIATPKFVEWDDPTHLLAVGATTDKVGVFQHLVEPGELDQEQHDMVREVLVAPTGATLIRSDLFEALGGFDPAIDQFGEDLDLCWRARVAGARITVVPEARVRHLQAFNKGQRSGWGSASARRRAARLAESHRVRTIVKCYRWFDLLWILPLAAAWSLGEATTRIFQGRPGEAWSLTTTFFAGFKAPGQLWDARRKVQRHRGAGDAQLRRLQVRGNARLRAFVRSRVDDVRQSIPHPSLPGRLGRTVFEEPDETAPPTPPERGRAAVRRETDWRVSALVASTALILLVIGSRSLIGHELPAVAQLPNTSGGVGDIWSHWWSAWQGSGLGVAAPSSPALALLGLLGIVLFGAVGTLQHVVVLAPLVLGPLGAWRAARWWGSRRGRIASLVAYAVVPLPYNALARGHWPAVVAYGAAPWVLLSLSRLSSDIPFPVVAGSRIAGRVVALGLVAAVVASVAPSFLVVVPLVGLALFLGSALARRAASGLRALAVSVGAAVVALVVLLPWSTSVLGSRAALLGVEPSSASRLGLGKVLTFHTGPFGGGVPGWALLAVAALPLFIGGGWRLEWAARMWVVALCFFALAWAGTRGWIPALPIEVVLAPAAAALAASAALGAVAFEMDLPGYSFGWRQVAAGVAGVALAVGSLPFVVASGGGRWHLPSADAASVLLLPDSHAGDYRVLWVGAPDALPLAGRQLDRGVAYATSFDGMPGVADDWVPGSAGATPRLASELKLVEGQLTTKFGHLLAAEGVRYVVVPSANGPTGSGPAYEPAPPALLAGLTLQTDLESLNVGDPRYAVFQNAAWAPARAVLSPVAAGLAASGAAGTETRIQQLDMSGSAPVLTGGSTGSSKGLVVPGTELYAASTYSRSWRLEVAHRSVVPDRAFGWAMSFQVPASAVSAITSSAVPARLSYRPPLSTRAWQILEILLWLAAAGFVATDARRRSVSGSAESADPAWFAAAENAAPRRGRRRPGSKPSPSDDVNDDEMWIDA